MGLYAAATAVSSEKSKMEIERTLKRYGADEFASGWDANRAVVMFRMSNRRIRYYLPLPERADYIRTKSGRSRHSNDSIEMAYEQAVRQRWRALSLAIKAKLEAVASGITTFDEEFLAHIVLPNGKTVAEWSVTQIAAACESKKMPPLLAAAGMSSERQEKCHDGRRIP